MNDIEATLDDECRVFTHYLVGTAPSAYAVTRYRDAHARLPGLRGSSRFDRLLLRLARAGSVATRLTDGYARFFVPGSLLRDKLVLLLAILETSDAADRLRLAHGAGGPLRCVAGAAAAGLVSAVLLPLAVLCLAPLQFALKLTERRR